MCVVTGCPEYKKQSLFYVAITHNVPMIQQILPINLCDKHISKFVDSVGLFVVGDI